MGLDDRDERLRGRERPVDRTRRPDAYNEFDGRRGRDYDDAPPAGRSSSRAPRNNGAGGSGSRGEYRGDRPTRRDEWETPASRRPRSDDASGVPRYSRSARETYDDPAANRRSSRNPRDPRDPRERSGDRAMRTPRADGWDAPPRSSGGRRPPADGGWGDTPGGTTRSPRAGYMDRGDMSDPRRGPRTPHAGAGAVNGMGNMGAMGGMGSTLRGQIPRGGLNGRAGMPGAAAAAEAELPAKKRGLSPAASFGIIVLMLVIGVGVAYGYFLLSTPRVQGDTSGGAAPAVTAPSTTPAASPSTTPHSFLWVNA